METNKVRWNTQLNALGTRQSLCWHCSKVGDGTCLWGSELKPVAGWKAIFDDRKNAYYVLDCPEFDIYEQKTMTDKGAERLANAVLAAAGADYLELCREAAEIKKDIERLKTCYVLYGNKFRHIYGRTKVKLLRYNELKADIRAAERFFRSEQALMFCEGDPVYVMEQIQKHTGVSYVTM